MKPKVLVIGALGHIGRRIVPLFSDCFELFLTDRAEGDIEGQKVRALDITDYPAVLAAMRGMDAVLHLAIASQREFVTDRPRFMADEGEEYLRFNEATIEVNLRGTYHVFEAARECGVKRVVYGSSLTVYLGKPAYPEFNDTLPPRPSNFYAVTKLFGEQLGEFFSRRHGLTVYCLRFGDPYPKPGADWLLKAPPERRCLVTYRDLAGAAHCALTTKDGPAFGAYMIISAGRNSVYDLSGAQEIGWQPQDFCEADGSVVPL